MSTSTPIRNTGPLCAEFHGNNCPDPETCPYRPASDIPWSDYDPRIVEHRQHQRALLRSFRHGYKLGFWTGVLAMFAALFILAVIQWATR